MIKAIWLDDDKALMDKHENDFKQNGIDIIKCTTSTQALEQITDGGLQNLILDLEFPNSKRDGILFLHQIIKLKPSLCVVILTGHPLIAEATDLVKKKSIAEYIEKPIPDTVGEFKTFAEKIKYAFNTWKRYPDETEINHLLKKWRKKTWVNLWISLALILFAAIAYIGYYGWDVNVFFQLIQNNKMISIPIGILVGLFEIFILRDLYNKYYNHANINHYIQRYRDSNL